MRIAPGYVPPTLDDGADRQTHSRREISCDFPPTANAAALARLMRAMRGVGLDGPALSADEREFVEMRRGEGCG